LQEIGIRTLNILTESGIYAVYFQDSIEKRGMSGDSRALWIWMANGERNLTIVNGKIVQRKETRN